jgi:hypothetical protein
VAIINKSTPVFGIMPKKAPISVISIFWTHKNQLFCVWRRTSSFPVTNCVCTPFSPRGFQCQAEISARTGRAGVSHLPFALQTTSFSSAHQHAARTCVKNSDDNASKNLIMLARNVKSSCVCLRQCHFRAIISRNMF